MERDKLQELFGAVFSEDKVLFKQGITVSVLNWERGGEENSDVRYAANSILLVFEAGDRDEPSRGSDFGDLVLATKTYLQYGRESTRFNLGSLWPNDYFTDDTPTKTLTEIANKKIDEIVKALRSLNLHALQYFLNENKSGKLRYSFEEFPQKFSKEFDAQIIEQSVMACIKDVDSGGTQKIKKLMELAKTASELSEESAALEKYLGIARQLNSRGDDVLRRVYGKHRKETMEFYEKIANQFLNQQNQT